MAPELLTPGPSPLGKRRGGILLEDFTQGVGLADSTAALGYYGVALWGGELQEGSQMTFLPSSPKWGAAWRSRWSLA